MHKVKLSNTCGMENFKMLPYTNGVILDSASNYGIVKTETIFRFSPEHENFLKQNVNSTVPLKWIYSGDKPHKDTMQDKSSSRSIKYAPKATVRLPESHNKKSPKALGKKHKKKKDKLKKCVFKLFKKGNKKKNKHKKYMMPLFIGVLAAKSLLIAIALKALAFISAKGLIMGFFSTMMASVLSLKGMFDHSHGWNRRDDTKTQVEIIQVPSKSDEHLHYDHYKRGDRLPLQVIK